MLQRLLKPAALAVVLSLSAHMAWAERKALVIGNANYTQKRLTNAAHDAEDMTAALKGLGFTVSRVNDADKRLFLYQLEAFRNSLSRDDDAVIYYAGHGAQFAGHNYLVPLNAAINRDEDLETEAVDLQRFLNALGPVQNGLKLAILDACRNNPYPGSGRSGTRGLARVDNVPNQTLLWFAASPGEEADNGPRRNGLFTEQLLKYLDQPGLKAEDVFKQVSRAVIAATQNNPKPQHPYPEGQTLVDFYFAAAPVDATPEPAPVVMPKPMPVTPPVQPEPPAIPTPKPQATPFGIRMVKLPGGTFQMGCGPNDEACNDNEKPRHSVTVPAFAIGKTEITQGQWKAVMGSAPPELEFKNCGERCPVERVSWNDVQEFIKTLNRKTGGHYRLPSEAEWEYACRAGQDTLYCGGDDVDVVAWYDGNSGNKKKPVGGNDADAIPWLDGNSGYSGKTTHPVGGKAANKFGLYDMSGNVWEWVQDCWHDSYQGAPGDGSAWDGSTECAFKRALRGGSWGEEPAILRSAFRNLHYQVGTDVNIGFRLAQD